jgi:hypothetical protein
MEEKINKMNSLLSKCYIVFWLLPILIVILGECNWIPTGNNAADVRATYYYEVVGILLTAALVPISLKLFHWTMVKKIDTLSFPEALRKYGIVSILRIGLLALVVVFNFLAYYLALSTTCILCSCIGLVASLFCIPSDRRLREELHITTDTK